MTSIKPSFAIIQDTRKATKEGLFPLKLRVTFNRDNRRYGLGYELSIEDFSKLFSTKLRDERLKDIRFDVESQKSSAELVGKKISPFTFEKFKEEFFEKPDDIALTTDVYKTIESYVKSLRSEDRISTASSYESTLNSFKKFKRSLSFEEITLKLLNDYERWMLNQGNSMTTIGIYLRSLRAIYNQAIEEYVVDKDSYPFGKKKYQIPSGRNVKKALTIKEVEKIFKYETLSGTTEDKARDFWMFSYLCNGINIKDIARLKYKDISKDRITIIRAKTERTTKSDQRQVVIPLSEKVKDIIDKWGNTPRLSDSFVFDILRNEVSSQRERELIQNITKTINKYMNRIAKELDIDKNLTTYVARHSFSTVLKRSGVSTEFISEALGHHSLATTESYLDSFEDDKRMEYASLLTNFKTDKK